MLFPENLGKNFFYLYEKILDYTDISVGIIIKSISLNEKVAYVDFKGNAKKLTNFFENLSLSKEFSKEHLRIKLDIYSNNNSHITKSILPMVEYQNLDRSAFFKNLVEDYDKIIFENIEGCDIDFELLMKFLKLKNEKTNVIFTSSCERFLNRISAQIDKISIIKTVCENSLISNKNVNYFLSNSCENRRLNSYGNVIRNFIDKVKVIYISFLEKGSDEEKVFFWNLKIYSKNNPLYSNFDFIIFNNRSLVSRKNLVNLEDYEEYLKLLITILKKNIYTVVIDNIYNLFVKNNVYFDEVLDLLKKVNTRICINSDKNTKKIYEMANKTIRYYDYNQIQEDKKSIKNKFFKL